MEVVRLDSTYRPDVLVEGWSTMIWTERYAGLGEFAMTTPLISDARALIPEGTYISLLDSDEVMLVETHSIERNDQGGVVNKITGRTFGAIFSERDTVGRGVNTSLFPGNWEMRRYYSPAQAAAGLIWNHLVNNGIPHMLPAEDTNGDPITQAGDARLLIPNLQVTMTNVQVWNDPNPDTNDGENPDPWHVRKWVMDKGTLDRPIFDFLAQGKLGIRSRRPRSGNNANVFGLDANGAPYTVNTAASDQIRLDVYQGRDLTQNVVFRYDAGQIEKPTYLYSIASYKNIAHVSSAQKELIVAAPGVDPNVSGLNRRVLYFDAGDLGDLDVEGNFTDADWDRILTQKALTELEKYNTVALFDGEISPLNAIKYGQHYALGDKVRLSAEYDLEATMVVSEYIRNQDEDGETGYPTLTFVD